MTGQWSASVDAYRRAVELTNNDTGHQVRYWVVSGMVDILKHQMHGRSTEEQRSLLKKIREGEFGDALVTRALAGFSLGLLHWGDQQRDKAARSYRKTIDLCELATAQDKAVKVLKAPGPGGWATAASILADRHGPLEEARTNLSVLQGETSSASVQHPSFDEMVAEYRENGYSLEQAQEAARSVQASTRGAVKVTRTVRAKDQQLVQRTRKVHGDACDQCGKSRGEQKLLMCSRCKRRYYCDKMCFAQAWKEGHKVHCRSPHTFQVGDAVLIEKLVNATELNGCVGFISGELSSGTGSGEDPSQRRWQVALYGDQDKVVAEKSLKAANLAYLMDD